MLIMHPKTAEGRRCFFQEQRKCIIIFVRTRKRTKPNENVYCTFQALKVSKFEPKWGEESVFNKMQNNC